MKTVKMLTILVLVTMLCLNEVSKASFLDDFENPGSVSYTFSNSYGSGGSFEISGGKFKITTGNDNTASVMTTDYIAFSVGETLSLNVPPVLANQSTFMMCSTTAGQPDGTSTFGFRFRRDGPWYARMELCPGGILTPCPLDPSPGKPATLLVKRTSDTNFEYSIRIEGQVTQLGSFTLSQLSGIINLHIGVQGYGLSSVTFAFDNLQVSTKALSCTDITVLTYNTHLFEGVSIQQYFPRYQDETRRAHIAAEIRASGADIVALQEVWATPWQEWFANELEANYPYAAYVDSTCDTYVFGIDALDDGVLLLSKWPLSDVKFEKFWTYTQCNITAGCDAWANKGVITATVNVGGAPIRIGISHTLTGPDDDKSNWFPDYVANAITSFQLNEQPYIFALKTDGQADIRRFEDYSYFDEVTQTEKHGAGWKHVYTGTYGSDYRAVVSFELNGHPHLFGLSSSKDEAYITRINNDPSTGWQTFGPYFWDKDYRPTAITSFQLNGQAYIFGLKSTWNQAWFYRINTDPSTGEFNPSVPFEEFGYKAFSRYFGAITSFESNGHPWLYSLKSNFEQVYLQRINLDPSTGKLNRTTPFTTFGPFEAAIDRHFIGETITSFQLNGRAYIFGLKSTWDQAWLYRIKSDPSTGLESLGWYPWTRDYVGVESFEMNGHPYLFALRNCCHDVFHLTPCLHWRPGEAYLKRINDDPTTGWENLYQLEDIKMIRDATVVEDGPPAIMMGDLNIHRGKYGIMDQLFRKAGAVDAYAQVADTAQDGNTINWFENKLMQYFWPDEDPADPDLVDRIDYVYVKETGGGLKLVPKEAYVIRDWKYDDGSNPNMDLSDHYPLVVKFEMRDRVDINNDCGVDFKDFVRLASAWLTMMGEDKFKSECDISDPPDELIDIKDLGVLAENWLLNK